MNGMFMEVQWSPGTSSNTPWTTGYADMGVNMAVQARSEAVNESDCVKVQTAELNFERLLPSANSHRTGALTPTRSVMQMNNEHSAFS